MFSLRAILPVLVAAAALPPAGCGPRAVEGTAPPRECPLPVQGGEIRWYRPESAEEREEQRRWCAGAGPPVIRAPARPVPPAPLDSLAILCWNTHVGGGAVEYLIRQLRTGVLTTGRPVEHFVVLLQETYRAGAGVPREPPPGTRYAGEIFPEPELGERVDVVEIGRRHGLYVYYVPSMRNGEGLDPPEDRGNAILSTLPPQALTAWDLPIRIERRVTIGAAFAGITPAGEPWRVFFTNLHLDLRTNVRFIVRSFSGVRRYQIGFVLDNLPGDGAAVLAGDFNTWFGEKKEPAILRARERFPLPERIPSHGTLEFGPVLERQTDYMFFRLPEHWTAGYGRIDDTYGSDHYPLLGWIRFGPPPGGVTGGPAVDGKD
jgi:endonuclease/exonuclease/phosphatase family metal-dependent hydrolase